MTMLSRGRRIGWTVADKDQRCDGCGGKENVSILHMGRDGEVPSCALAALCKHCVVAALDDASKWS